MLIGKRKDSNLQKREGDIFLVESNAEIKEWSLRDFSSFKSAYFEKDDQYFYAVFNMLHEFISFCFGIYM